MNERQPMRFSLQYINRPNLDFRGYAGTVAIGYYAWGRRYKVPTGITSTISRTVTFDGDLPGALWPAKRLPWF
ncbi:hypothetical protein [Sodalis-like endosymbiont of Proechinophthirus fluctus]|uniref:hypothetical protein n=1 Tax=Sodalis-like endosymbiont of Proechinophthirus fluctus TaxID=1462730 RepID=UPI003F7508D6